MLKVLFTAISFVVIFFVGWVDLKTGSEIGFSLFYLIPIVAIAWLRMQSLAFIVASFASLVWFVADYSLRPDEKLSISLWNGFTRLGVYAAIGSLIARNLRKTDELREIGRQLHQSLQTEAVLARTDALTGLPNTRAFQESLVREVARCDRDQSVLSLMYIDIDNFKKVNDALGHEQGDLLLQRLAHLLQSVIRASDTPGRLGGDEFAVLLPDTAADAAQLVAERYRDKVAELEKDYSGYGLGASIGIATKSLDTPDAASLIKAADDAMYTGKRSRKDSFAGIKRQVRT